MLTETNHTVHLVKWHCSFPIHGEHEPTPVTFCLTNLLHREKKLKIYALNSVHDSDDGANVRRRNRTTPSERTGCALHFRVAERNLESIPTISDRQYFGFRSFFLWTMILAYFNTKKKKKKKKYSLTHETCHINLLSESTVTKSLPLLQQQLYFITSLYQNIANKVRFRDIFQFLETNVDIKQSPAREVCN
jgi:hypothetical protein